MGESWLVHRVGVGVVQSRGESAGAERGIFAVSWVRVWGHGAELCEFICHWSAGFFWRRVRHLRVAVVVGRGMCGVIGLGRGGSGRWFLMPVMVGMTAGRAVRSLG